MANQSGLHKFDRWFRQAESFEASWRKNNDTNFDYYDGDQWTNEEKAVLTDRGQQDVVMNVIRPTIDMVLALEVQKRVDVMVVPREESDEVMARLLTELLKQVNDVSDADYYTSKSFREGIIGGRGVVETTIELDEMGEKQVAVNWVPWEELYIDPFHRRPDGSDARFMFRKVWMDRDEVKEKWGSKAEDVDTTFTDDYHGVEYEAQTTGNDRSSPYYDNKTERIGVVYCWYRESSGELKHVVFADDVFFKGGVDAANEDPLGIDMYPWTPCYAFRTHKGYPKGLVEYIRSPQDQLNKLNSKYLWNMSANRLMIEEGATDDMDQVRDEWNKPDGKVVLNEGGLSRIRQDDNLRESSYLASHMQFLIGMIQRTSGVNDAMIGVGGVNERSATQQENRILQGASMQTQILENLYFCKKQVSRAVLRLIGKYYTGRRVVRIIKPTGEWMQIALNDPLIDNETGEPVRAENGEPVLENRIDAALKYDVVLKMVPSFSSTHERTLTVLGEVAKTGVIPGEVLATALLQLSDIPGKEELIFRVEQFYKQQRAAMSGQPAEGAGVQ